MSGFFSFLSMATFCFTLLGIAFMVVLSLPDSKMREVAKHVVMVAACVIYVFSPIDLLPEVVLGPFGLLDDFAAVYAAYKSARVAWQGGNESAGKAA